MRCNTISGCCDVLPDDGILTYCTSGAEDVQMSFVMYNHVMHIFLNVK